MSSLSNLFSYEVVKSFSGRDQRTARCALVRPCKNRFVDPCLKVRKMTIKLLNVENYAENFSIGDYERVIMTMGNKIGIRIKMYMLH